MQLQKRPQRLSKPPKTDNMLFDRTIAAISTPPGKGGVAVIRISGADALSVAEKIFVPKGKIKVKELPARVQIYGNILYGTEEIDDGLITYFPSPNSYTGEDVAEISCHGGILVTRCVLQALLAAGAVLAEPGEFTKRAFVNGKLTLPEAEAIGLLLDAEGAGQMKLANVKSRDALRDNIQKIHNELLGLMGSIFARIDYPEEDLGDFTDEQSLRILQKTEEEISKLIATYKTGSVIKDGIKVTICGSPNAGKSTLYNLLSGEESAIVTAIPGTTRDVLERTAHLGDILLRLCDTAGIREQTDDPIEKIGIERSRERIKDSSLILALFDASDNSNSKDAEIIDFLNEVNNEKIAILTKTDIATEESLERKEAILKAHFDNVIKISAKENGDEAKEALSKVVAGLFTDEKLTVGTDAIISSANQYGILMRAWEAVRSAISCYENGLTQDLAASDVEAALIAISELDGRGVCEEVVANIFSRFCVGK